MILLRWLRAAPAAAAALEGFSSAIRATHRYRKPQESHRVNVLPCREHDGHGEEQEAQGSQNLPMESIECHRGFQREAQSSYLIFGKFLESLHLVVTRYFSPAPQDPGGYLTARRRIKTAARNAAAALFGGGMSAESSAG